MSVTYAHGCQESHEPGMACEHGPSCSDCYLADESGCRLLLNWCPVCRATFPLEDDDCRACDGKETTELLKNAREEAAAERTKAICLRLRDLASAVTPAQSAYDIERMFLSGIPLPERYRG